MHKKYLNGQIVIPGNVYVLNLGASLRDAKMKPIYYSDIVNYFFADEIGNKIQFVAKDVEYYFKGGVKGLNSINIVQESGSLVGIMGASGSGKTTLLNVLNGSCRPTSGTVTINGIDIYDDKKEQSYESLLRSAQRSEDSLLSMPGILPVNPSIYRVSSSFGWRMHPIKNRRIPHDGIDIAAREGNKVYATGKGVVVSVSNDPRGYGKQVVIDHGYGYKTRYAHLSKYLVHVGDSVCRGAVVGLIGNTGISTGPHLHYEVIVSGIRKNPDSYLSFGSRR